MCVCVCVCSDAARFNCENGKVSVGERNVCLKCEVRAQPRLTSLFWIIDDNGTTVHEGEVVDRYWTLILVSHIYYQLRCCRFCQYTTVYIGKVIQLGGAYV